MKWDITDIKTWKPEQHLHGGTIPDAGNSCSYLTGGWRTDRPVRDTEKCTQCLFCYFYCPDGSVVMENEKIVAFDYDHCKGCGICATECPADAISMHPETEFGGGE